MRWAKTVFTSLHEMLEENGVAAVAVSGGSDSMALLRLMVDYNRSTHRLKHLMAATVDHGLRPTSAREAEQVKNWCHDLNIEHVTLRWDKPEVPKTAIQKKARQARYALLLELCHMRGVRYLLTAHHQEDQIETFFLRLFKGSGPAGLGGMNERTTLSSKEGSVTLLRPLLNVSKKEILSYMKNIGQDFITDPSNDNRAFERIKVRQMVSHLRSQSFDVDHILKTMDHCQRQNTFIESLLEHHRTALFQEGRLDIKAFLALDPFLQQTFLRDYLWRLSEKDYPPKFEIVGRVMHKLNQGKTFTIGGHIFKKSGTYYCISREERGR